TLLLKLSLLEAAILGTVLAAVSPAVVVPRMLKLQNEGYGTDKKIPQMITAGASCDDVFVIVIFTALIAMSTGGSFNFHIIWRIPTSIILGIGVGCLFGYLFALFFKRFHMRDTIKIIILLSFSFIFVAIESLIGKYVPFSGLLAVISLGVMLNFKDCVRAKRLSSKYSKLWIFAEILLFVLVGAEVNFSYVQSSGLMIIAVMLLTLVFRVFGVFACLIRTNLNLKERIFCAIAYLPKATVQAAIGAIPFTIGLACGQIVLTCAVLAILITAPLGAVATDMSYKKLLTQTFCNNDISDKP
ncbi:MAG: cation:proton antiporter, partial [Clostridia bacterium]